MYRKIFVLVDNRKVTQSAIDQAIALAQIHHADIFFCSMLPRVEYPALNIEETSRMLVGASTWAERCGVHHQGDVGLCDDNALAVADAAVKHQCDLIVVGSGGKGTGVHSPNGIFLQDLMSAATVPVLVCRERPILLQSFSAPIRTSTNNFFIRREVGTRRLDEPND